MAARDAAEAAIDENPDPVQVFAAVGCVWADARAAATRSATAMVGVLCEDVKPDQAGEGRLVELMAETWLNGLLVGLFLSGLTATVVVDEAALMSATGAPAGAGQSFSSRVAGSGLDPDAASEAAMSVGVTASRRGNDSVADVDWSAAQASVWLDGLIVALIARGR
jgi:hypothetical protein